MGGDLLGWWDDRRLEGIKVMAKILQATCVNGGLVLESPLSPVLEGQTVHLILVENDREVAMDEGATTEWEARALRFLEKAKQFSASLPVDYKFDRNEIYDR